MVNVEKHRRKALENEVIDVISFIKPKLASGMNMNHFRPQLKREIELKQKLF